MDSFEKKYYESDSFWEDGKLEDENNKQRIITTANLIPKEVRSLADIGCGNGVFLNYLKANKPGLELLGIDRSETALKFVQTNKQVGGISSLPFADNSFDGVTCLEVIEHLPVPVYEQAIKELSRISRKYVIISVPYAEKIEDSCTQCPQCHTIFNYELHLRRFEKNDMEKLLIKYNYACISTQTLGDCVKFYGQDLFRKIFYPGQVLKWNSPLCPVCGFSEVPERKDKVALANIPPKRNIISYFTVIPKLFWPKSKRHYWILSLYEKKQGKTAI